MAKNDEDKRYPEDEDSYDNETEEDIEDDMETGKKDADVYTEAGRDELEDEDEISPGEEGFMEGAEGKGEDAVCRHCGQVLGDDEAEVVARRVNGKRELFCSDECADEYEMKHGK